MAEPISWYEVVEGAELQQGDLLRAFLVAKPLENIEVGVDGVPMPSPLQIETHDIIVLTQSCDLVNQKTNSLIVCPHFRLVDIVVPDHVRNNPKLFAKFHEQIRRGWLWPLHMLAASQELGLEDEIRVVDFRLVSIASLNFAKRTAGQTGQRLRLKSPYVEHLSQAFARFFMRVGLPSDIPNFTGLP